MKKIIAALDGLDFSVSAAKYAAYLASSSKATLSGIFLDDITYHSYRIYDLLGDEGLSERRLKEMSAKEDQIRKDAVKEFEKICKQADAKFKVRHDRSTVLKELLIESIYTDMLVIDRRNTFGNRDSKIPGSFLKSALNNMACPALVVPSSFRIFHKLIFLYDGNPPSVYAIKAFSYLLTSFCKLPLEILTVKQSRSTPDISDKYLMNDWIKKYYMQISYKEAEGDPEDVIIQYAKTQKVNPLFIVGARPQGVLSPWFRESMADILIKKLQAPLFVARY
jgi:nucleotide-binding universal stress UspA family protein